MDNNVILKIKRQKERNISCFMLYMAIFDESYSLKKIKERIVV